MLLAFATNTILLMYQNQAKYHQQNVTKDGKKFHIQKKFILFHLLVDELCFHKNKIKYFNVANPCLVMQIQWKPTSGRHRVKCCFTSCIICANFAYMLSTLPFDTPQLQQLDVIIFNYFHNYNISRVQISKIIVNKSRCSSQDL